MELIENLIEIWKICKQDVLLIKSQDLKLGKKVQNLKFSLIV